MADINLLQNQLKDTTHASQQRTRIVVVIFTLVLILIVGAGAFLYIYTDRINTQVAEVTADNAKLQQQINSSDATLSEAKKYQAQLSNMDLLLRNHIEFTPFMEEFGNYTYQRTQIVSLDIDQIIGKIHIEGIVDTYEDLGKLLLGLSTSSNFSNVKLISVAGSNTGTTNGYTFSMDLRAGSSLFINQPIQ